MKIATTYRTTKWGEVWHVKDTEEHAFRFAIYRYFDDDSTIYLSNVFVNEKFRQQGLGNKILEMADESAKRLGAFAIILKVLDNSFAKSWYERHGYTEHSRFKNQKGYVWMIKVVK